MTNAFAHTSSYDFIILGAGIAGMAAARELAQTGARVLVIEKSRGIGGRGSLRRGPDWKADLGLPFVLEGSKHWDQFLGQISENLRTLPLLNAGKTSAGQVHTQGMNALIKSILPPESGNVDFCFSTRVMKIVTFPIDREMVVKCAPPSEFRAPSLILTAPAPQSAAILSNSTFQSTPSATEALTQPAYGQSFSVVFKCKQRKFQLPAPLWTHCNDDIVGLFDQGAKGFTDARGVYVAHTSSAFSSGLWENSDEEIVKSIKSRMFDLSQVTKLGLDSQDDVEILSFHRWRYAQCITPIEKQSFQQIHLHDREAKPQIILAGDCFGPKKLEPAARAFESGFQAAHALLNRKFREPGA